MTKDFSKIGKASKRKGNVYENLSAKFWEKELGTKVRRTPRSGAFFDWPGDIMDLGESVLKEFVVDVKSEKNLLNKKILVYFQKNKEDALGKMSFLELYVNFDNNSPYILITRQDLAKLLKELEGYRKGGK